MILYLHGFRSSPASWKVRMLKHALEERGRSDELLCPQLPASPRGAVELAEQLLRMHYDKPVTVIGSSLGGYYATWLAERHGLPAVLLNPVVTPIPDWSAHIGVATGYHDQQPFEFRAEYVEELYGLAVQEITDQSRYMLYAATGDEVLDWRAMVSYFKGARTHVIEGSDHALSDFPAYLDNILAFCDGPQRL